MMLYRPIRGVHGTVTNRNELVICLYAPSVYTASLRMSPSRCPLPPQSTPATSSRVNSALSEAQGPICCREISHGKSALYHRESSATKIAGSRRVTFFVLRSTTTSTLALDLLGNIAPSVNLSSALSSVKLPSRSHQSHVGIERTA